MGKEPEREVWLRNYLGYMKPTIEDWVAVAERGCHPHLQVSNGSSSSPTGVEVQGAVFVKEKQ